MIQDILNLEPFRMLEIEKSELQKVDELYYFEIFNIIDNYEQSKKDEILNLPYFVKLKKDTDIEKPSMTKIPAIINKIKGMITIQQADLKGLYKEIIEDRIEQMMYEEMGNIYSDDYKDCKDNESIYSVIITKIGERTAVKAARDALTKRQTTLSKLGKAANELGLVSVLTKYQEVIVP